MQSGPSPPFDTAPNDMNTTRATTKATTRASAIANWLRQIRDRSHPATTARSAVRVASRIYAHALLVYLDADTFTATFPDQSLLVASPTGPAVPRGRAKTAALARARPLPAHLTRLPDVSRGNRVTLRHVLHAVVTTYDREIHPQRHLHVSVAQPGTDDVQRHLPDHQPVPSRAVPQTVSARAPLTRTGRLLVETSPLDPIADVPHRRPHRQRHHLKAE